MLQYILECIAFQLVFSYYLRLFSKAGNLFSVEPPVLDRYLRVIIGTALGKDRGTKKHPFRSSIMCIPSFLWNSNAVSATATSSEAPGLALSVEEGIIYGGMIVAAAYFGYKLFQIYKLRNNGAIQRFPNFTQIIVKNSELAFSFFKSIFLGDKVIQREHKSIIEHELVHIEQRHSWDLLFFELMRIVGWFNPLVYVYQSRVSELHEFIADSKVAKTDKKEQYEFFAFTNLSDREHITCQSILQDLLNQKAYSHATAETVEESLAVKVFVVAAASYGNAALYFFRGTGVGKLSIKSKLLTIGI